MNASKSGFAERCNAWELCILGLLILLSLPSHATMLFRSFWLDEAWVANSVLSPSLHQMFFYDRWAQSTPPLLLLLMRAATLILGPREIAFRAVPWLAGVAALILFSLAIRKLFSWPVSLLAATFFATNYWAIKYSQQAKQYESDLFVAALLLFLVANIRVSGWKAWSRGALILAGALGSFLSLPVLFWFPGIILVMALRDPRAGGPRLSKPALPDRRRHAGWTMPAVLLATCLAVSYLGFLRPNITPGFSRSWDRFTLGAGGGGVAASFENISQLLLPAVFPWMRAVAPLLPALACLGMLRSIIGARRGDATSVSVLLAATLPILAAALLSLATLYPLGGQQRVILWMLPELILLLCYALSSPLDRLLERPLGEPRHPIGSLALPVLCAAVILTNWALLIRHPAPDEDNRGAVAFVAANLGPRDCVLVHGGISEQFDYYRQFLSRPPDCVYLGNTGWPCCDKNRENRVSNPRARTAEDDLSAAAARAPAGRLWTLVPSGAAGHWSGALRSGLLQLPELMSHQGCAMENKTAFGNTVVYSFRCR